MTTKTVKVMIGTQEVELRAPPSISTQLELYTFYVRSSLNIRPFGAALGACWASPKGRPNVNVRALEYEWGLIGQAVMDDLLARPGVTEKQLMEAGRVAIDLIQAAYIGREEVDKEAGNSEGEDAPTS